MIRLSASFPAHITETLKTCLHRGIRHPVAALLFALPMSTLAAPDTALKPGREYLAVANYPNQLQIIDAVSDVLYKTCPLPDDFGPALLQISPDRTKAYILNNHYQDIYGIELDSCKPVFHASLQQAAGERVRAMFSIALSPDGKSVYTIVNRTRIGLDHYEVLTPKLLVFDTASGMDAKPVRSFDAPRQTTLIQVGNDGSLYVLGPDVYKVDPATGQFEVALTLRNWNRPGHGAPDVLYPWSQQRPQNTFSFLYTMPRFKDETQDMATADVVYGIVDIDLKTGKASRIDFADFTEVLFTGAISPKNPNHVFGVLNHLAKYDIREKKQIGLADLDHTYYVVSLNTEGTKAYLAGALNDVAVFDTDSLRQLKTIKLPGGDMGTTTPQIFIR
ncbi:MAG: quinohemoprotein amine dehydrogenase subunit beta [Lautropia sp.]|nr:quinohemoprotein amine dehydrogenase subunit beta [Lautropia sp.]